ncbi:restriction endonuclease subunit S [Acinetobacter sp. ANC 3926]|uniref:Type I restriction enzyme, S subunit n=1 Tax=Acinetobacter genomosp. 15BJ TaxID=106651 RepID=R9BD08_9GAMM|nr:restriction endonuclease subunit S [Acinetobacter genomosp. 15BJ]EOR10256.1 type I restriction enzyme, S subunit [Acinetobacter genomosp. 15BJ]MCH7292833.1 restriction endonuclease subunit S [Acinetobacter genomosp. 15BJ]
MSVPELRFNEFDESWSQVILDDLAEVERGKFSVRPRNDPRYFGGKMPFVQTGDVTGSDVYLKGFSQTLNEDGIKVSKVFPEDTILITIAANIGDTTITQYPVACPDSVVAIQPKKELTNTIFLKNVIDLQKDFLDSQATQNAQKNINLQVLKPLELIVPSLKEQTKIASFLSAVDEKISQLTQKHELLSQYKQGMMQKLFSQQIRFKADDSSEFGEWEEVTLSKVSDVRDGTHDSPSYVKDGYPLITSKNLKNGKLDLTDINLISEDDYLNINKRSAVNIGDIIFGMIGTIGNPVLLKSDGFAIKNVALIKEKDELLNIYLIHYLNSSFFAKQVALLNTGNTQKFLALGQIRSLSIHKPQLAEQTKIANFLSSIDQKIEVVVQQIEQAKQWKKGLLQQMFV